jgi:hypothetical protein
MKRPVLLGGGYAVLSWNGWSVRGSWVWRWKGRIDRRFIENYRGL